MERSVGPATAACMLHSVHVLLILLLAEAVPICADANKTRRGHQSQNSMKTIAFKKTRNSLSSW
jgi:hypothetical protein